jgi:hypothetical protein
VVAARGRPHPYYAFFDETAALRLEVTPKDAAVYVDGYYAGVVDDFDGIFQRLGVPPGPHELTFFLQGFRTAHPRLYLAPNSDSKVRLTLERLAPGDVSAAPPVAAPVPPPPARHSQIAAHAVAKAHAAASDRAAARDRVRQPLDSRAASGRRRHDRRRALDRIRARSSRRATGRGPAPR